MNTLRERLLYLQHAAGAGALFVHHLLDYDKELHAPFDMAPEELAAVGKITLNRAQLICRRLQAIGSTDLPAAYAASGAGWMTIFDDSYPALLKTIYDPPAVLFYQGSPRILQNCFPLAVIGPRKPSPEASEILKELLPPLLKHRFLIVSGLAEGVDSSAHELSLRYKSPTAAVLGSGFNHIYPRSNISLARTIAGSAILLSEYAPWQKPQKWHFPERNRLISGLSRAVLIIEAREKSGTMITAGAALEQGRDVFAVPGSPLKKEAAGCNILIQEGAKPVFRPEDIMEEFQINGMKK
ncbi:DNA-processing protein DprA [Alteribacter natronophilus]|uniref:DNA-processing protein DprA n=1 Tax=Alteribacter natronophilus TaxID=2583810 RepID=UPI00110EDED7|nr:DNA-processing protein DprA [Alteribacter natronophilus]TMW73201.1 DNA-protecting protein DprA [Alteribacter natronophilus]